jgi:hypothetical protein
LICAAVATVVGAGTAQPQQREAVLQQVEVVNGGFNIVIATAKPDSAAVDYRGEPNPYLAYLAAGDLVYAYTGGRLDLAEDAIFTPPACSFNVERKEFGPRTPVVIYVIPKGTTPSVAITRHPGSQ